MGGRFRSSSFSEKEGSALCIWQGIRVVGGSLRLRRWVRHAAGWNGTKEGAYIHDAHLHWRPL